MKMWTFHTPLNSAFLQLQNFLQKMFFLKTLQNLEFHCRINYFICRIFNFKDFFKFKSLKYRENGFKLIWYKFN